VGCRGTILVRKEAATKERNAKSCEILRADRNFAYGRSRLAGRVRLAFDVKRVRELEEVGGRLMAMLAPSTPGVFLTRSRSCP